MIQTQAWQVDFYSGKPVGLCIKIPTEKILFWIYKNVWKNVNLGSGVTHPDGQVEGNS